MKYRPWTPVTVQDKPLYDCHITKLQARALHMLARGEATQDEQVAAFKSVLHICGVDDLEFLPDEHGGERESAFKSGKRHVGLQLCKLATQPLHLILGET